MSLRSSFSPMRRILVFSYLEQIYFFTRSLVKVVMMKVMGNTVSIIFSP